MGVYCGCGLGCGRSGRWWRGWGVQRKLEVPQNGENDRFLGCMERVMGRAAGVGVGKEELGWKTAICGGSTKVGRKGRPD